MIRVLAISLIAILSAGPSVGLLCHTWCDDHVAQDSGCHGHATGATAVGSAGVDCASVLGTPARLPEMSRGQGEAPAAAIAQTATLDLGRLPDPGAVPAASRAAGPTRHCRPLQPVLRI